MTRRMRWIAALGACVALAWTLGCGGGGGGGNGGTGQITGSLSRSGAVQIARAARRPTWLALTMAWMAARSAFADGSTDCGSPTVPAGGVPVTLLDSSGATVQTTTTNAEGEFVFTGLAAGNYIVQVTLPIGTLSSPATVQEGQTTTLAGELDVDCEDDNGNGNKTEIELKVKQRMEDGAENEFEDVEDDQGDHSGPGHGADGEDHVGNSSNGSSSGGDSSGRGGSNHGED
jgi:SdrD B-like protein